MRFFGVLAVVALISACGDDTGGGAGTGGAPGTGGGDATGGSSAEGGGGPGTTTATGSTTGTTTGVGGGGGEGGAGETPIELAPFLFELDGVAQPDPEAINIEDYDFENDCGREISIEALLPYDPDVHYTQFRLEIEICSADVVPGEPLPLTPSGEFAPPKVIYRYSEPGSVYFPSATGTITVYDEGTGGRYQAVVDGMIELPHSGETVPIHVELDQPVAE